MKKIALFLAGLLMSAATVNAQYPCSNFNSGAGNWTTQYCTDAFTNLGPDGSQCVTVTDGPGGSAYLNSVDYVNLGQKYLHKCLCWDYQLVNDGGSGAPFYPTIYLSDGINTIAFVASTPVTAGSGWVHICAPIEHCTSSTLPSNSDGTWVMSSGMTCTDFNNVLDNLQTVYFGIDITSCPCEVHEFDNVCVVDCGCKIDYKVQTTWDSNGNAYMDIFLGTPPPGTYYMVNWGDGTGLTSPYVTHWYKKPGSYVVCIYLYDEKTQKVICSVCFNFCYGESDVIQGGGDGGAVGRTLPVNTSNIFGVLNDKQFANEGFAVFPNPPKDYAEIKLNLTKKDQVNIRVIDLYGKIVMEVNEKTAEMKGQNIKLNTEKLSRGIYTIEMNLNGNVSTQKINIEK